MDYIDPNGASRKEVFQIADVTRPLSSISEICDDNCRVVFGRSGGFIYHLADGSVTPFPRRGNLYELDMWVPVPEPPMNHECAQMCCPCGKGFQRRVQRASMAFPLTQR